MDTVSKPKVEKQKIVSDVIFDKTGGISSKIDSANYVVGILEERLYPYLFETQEETVTGFPSEDVETPPHDKIVDALDEVLIKMDEHSKNIEKIIKRTEK